MIDGQPDPDQANDAEAAAYQSVVDHARVLVPRVERFDGLAIAGVLAQLLARNAGTLSPEDRSLLLQAAAHLVLNSLEAKLEANLGGNTATKH